MPPKQATRLSIEESSNVLRLSTLEVLAWAHRNSVGTQTRQSSVTSTKQAEDFAKWHFPEPPSSRNPSIRTLPPTDMPPSFVDVQPNPPGFLSTGNMVPRNSYLRPRLSSLVEAGSSVGIAPESLLVSYHDAKSVELRTTVTLGESEAWPARWKESIKDFWRGWYQRNVPSWKEHSGGFQWFLIFLLTTPPIYFLDQSISQQFLLVMLAQSALAICEKTGGGVLKKAFERTTACTISTLMALCVFGPLYLGGVGRMSVNPWLHWLFYGLAILSTFVWAYIGYHFPIPTYTSLLTHGISTTLYIYALTGDSYILTLLPFWGWTVAGVIIGSLVFRFVFFRSARDILQDDLAVILNNLGNVLKPLIELEAGLIRSPTFFSPTANANRDKGVTEILARMVTKVIDKAAPALDKVRRRSSVLHSRRTSRASRRSVDTTTSMPRERIDSQFPPSRTMTAEGFQEVEYETFATFKEQLWSKIDEIWILLSKQEQSILHSRTEIIHTRARFRTDKYRALLVQAQRVYSHVCSLHLVLDNYRVSADNGFYGDVDSPFVEALKGRWEALGTVKIARSPMSYDVGKMNKILRHKTVDSIAVLDERAKRGLVEAHPIPKITSDATLDRASRQFSNTRFNPSEARNFDNRLSTSANVDMGRPSICVRRPSIRRPTLIGNLPPDTNGSFFPKGVGGRLLGEHQPFVDSSKYENFLANPVVRWAKMFGPPVGSLARNISCALIEFSTFLKERRIDMSICQGYIERSEKAAIGVVRLRNEWQRLFELLFSEFLTHLGVTGPRMMMDEERRKTEEAVFLMRIRDLLGSTLETWMGISVQEFAALPPEVKWQLWAVFWNIEDRLASTNRILIALLVELKATSSALENWAIVMGWPGTGGSAAK